MNGKEDRVRKSQTVKFEAKDGDAWGFAAFIQHKEVIELGFIKDNAILVKAYVEVLE